MMGKEEFDKDKLIRYWINSSDEDFGTMEVMYQSRRYNWALFVGHLMIEKLLKAYFVRRKEEFPPFIHNLLRLAEKGEIELNNEKKLFFITVTAFNINARYDDYKMSFQKKCTPEYTALWINQLKEKRLWLKELINA